MKICNMGPKSVLRCHGELNSLGGKVVNIIELYFLTLIFFTVDFLGLRSISTEYLNYSSIFALTESKNAADYFVQRSKFGRRTNFLGRVTVGRFFVGYDNLVLKLYFCCDFFLGNKFFKNLFENCFLS